MVDTRIGFGSLAPLVVALAACSSSAADSGGSSDRGGNATTSAATTLGGADGNQGGNPSRGGSPTPTGAAGSAGSSNSSHTTPGAIDCRNEGDGKTTLVFVNDCSQTLTFRGSDIAGGTLAPGAFACVDVGTSTETLSSKRYWGWVGTDPGSGRYTLAEFTFNTDFYSLDWYDISHVDAHNLPMAIRPSERAKCRELSCPQDFLASCPAVGQFRDEAGNLISCVSPNRDDPNNTVVLLFEQCDDAYAWSGDDQKGTDPSPMIGCEVEDFDIVFCPGAR
jgi:hypothetical protein